MNDTFSDEKFEVIVDRKADEITVRDIEGEVIVNGQYLCRNRHIGRLKGMMGPAKNLQMNPASKTVTMDLADYDETKDAHFYVQTKYIDSWSLEEPLNEESILDTKRGAGALRKFSEVFLRVNGIIQDVQVDEKK